tara:strand:+ start:419 stop:649 length:231 start_codon:yes stop_codon:yes gene_type:complete
MVAEIFALCMFVNGSLDGHMITDGLSHCLKAKREGERNLSTARENVIRYECGKVKAELVPDSEGNLKILRIIEDKY